MKKTVLISMAIIGIVILSLAISNSATHSEKLQEPEPVYMLIGQMIDNPHTRDIYEKTGMMLVIPYRMEDGIKMIGEAGYICGVYGHHYDDGICVVCGEKK